MNKTIVLIAGKKRSGKNYTAELLRDLLIRKNFSCEIMAYADPLKDMVSEIFNLDLLRLDLYKNEPNRFKIGVQDLEEDSFKPLTDFRQVLNDFGTPIMKSRFGNDIWVNLMKDNIKKSNSDILLIPDFRFPIEYWNLGTNDKVFTIRVERDGLEDSDLISENSLNAFEFDYTIDNNVIGYSNILQQLEDTIEEIMGGNL